MSDTPEHRFRTACYLGDVTKEEDHSRESPWLWALWAAIGQVAAIVLFLWGAM